MRRALLFALLLAVVLTSAVLRSNHAHDALPEASAPAQQTPIEPASSENCEDACESANAPSAPARERLPAATEESASGIDRIADTPVRIEVLYAGSGRPVRAAKVSVGPPLTEGLTDEQGVVELRVPIGSKLYSVRVNACDEGDPFVPYQRIIEQVILPGSNEVLARVDRGIDVRGIVRAVGTGAALSGATVTCTGIGYRTRVVSSADGSFLCEALLLAHGDSCSLSIEREGYLSATVQPRSVDLEPDAPPLLVLLDTGITVSGRVFDTDHKPVSGASLEVFTPAAFRAMSDDQGFFEISGIKPTEKATLYAQTQSWSRPPILERAIDLGALSASRTDVELEVQRAIQVRVFAELPDGSGLATSRFEVDWGDGAPPFWDRILLSPEFTGPQSAVLPLGRDFMLRGSARAPGTDDRSAILSGSARVHTDADVQSPLDVHLRLTEPGRLEIPPLQPGAGQVVLGESSELLGALDVQVFDETSGQPIEELNGLVYSRLFGQGDVTWLSPGAGGWLRIWHNLGARTAEVRHNQGPSEQVTISIPRSGYAKTEWRLRSKL